MKVTFCAYDGHNFVGGSNTWLRRLLPELRRRGVQTQVLFLTWSPEQECTTIPLLRQQGFECLVIPKPYYTEHQVRWILEKLAENPPDVFVPNLVLPAFYAGRWIRKAGIPTVGVLHSDDEEHRGIVSEFVFGESAYQVSGIVCVYQVLEQEVLKQHHKRTLVRRLPCGAPLPQQVAQAPIPKLSIAYVGRLVEEQKRISEVTRALCRTLKEVPDTEAVIYGSGPDRPSVERILQTQGTGLPVGLAGRTGGSAKMKIAVISTMAGYPWGGSEELWAAMADEALDKSFDLAISVYQWPFTPPKMLALQQKGALILKRPGLSPYRRFSKIRAINKIFDKVIDRYTNPFRDLFRLNPDVVCVNQPSTYDSVQFSSSADLLNMLYTTSIPYVVVCQAHTDLSFPCKTTREAALEFFSRAYRVVFVSHQNKQMTERQLAQALPNAVVLQNPVNLSNLAALPWPSSQQVCMASVARLEAMAKGQDILFEALSSLTWQSRDWQLRLYGAGSDQDYLEALTRHYGISDRVEFLGHVKDVRAIWSENHLLVLPSRFEGTPLAMVEAMLCGRPAVVTDVGGNAEWVEESQTGFVAEAPTAKSFSAALERAWLAQADWQKMGIKAHEKAIEKFDKSPGKSLLKVVLDAAH